MKNAAFDYDRLLALDGMSETQVFRSGATALYPDGTIDIRYEGLPLGAMGGAVQWLQKNRVILTNAVVAGVELPGTWRTVSIQEQLIYDGGRKVGTVLVQRFAKGLYDALDWSVCRVEQGTWTPGNSKDADGVENTMSALYQRYSVLRMPYVRPDKAEDIANSLKGVLHVEDLTAGGVLHDGIWFNLGATWRIEGDQTAAVLVTLAQPRFTIEGYRNHGTFEAERRFLVANAPAAQVQDILDAWKIGRVGADGLVESYHTERGTANIILTVQVPETVAGQRQKVYEDAFKVVTATTDINRNEAISQPGFTVGKVVSVDNEKTHLGKYNTTISEDVAKAGETPEHVVSVLADGTTIRAHTAKHLDAGSLPTWAEEPSSHIPGNSVRIARELNEYGGLEVRRQDRIVTQVRRPTTGEYVYDRDFGEVKLVEYDHVLPSNLATVLNEFAPYESTHTISATPDFDPETGTFSVRLVAVPKTSGSGGGGAKQCELYWTEKSEETHREYDKDTDSVISFKRITTWECGRKQDTSDDDIETWLNTHKPSSDIPFLVNVGALGRWGFFAQYRKYVSRTSWYAE